ncbi:MAG: DUF2285 domain-containing protein [Gammaproteobacteria bacterium]|nr:DUF2285 domain-containing protein [Gammaproteobacteria bacterium]
MPAAALAIVPAGVASATAPSFSVWRLPGPKILSVHARHDLLLATGVGGGALALTVDAGLLLGDAYAFRVPAETEPEEAMRVMVGVRSAMGGAAPSLGESSSPVSRTALVHLRALQALDGIAGEASHRTIARVLFGAEEVTRRWTGDGELRAQVRYLVRRARALRDGGYRSLLTPTV